jgi:hypothetical protein
MEGLATMMNKLLEIAFILIMIFGCAHFIQLDKEFDCVARTPEFEALRIKHGLRNTEIVWGSGGKWFYKNEQRQICRFE